MQNYDGYEKGYANMRLVVKEKEDIRLHLSAKLKPMTRWLFIIHVVALISRFKRTKIIVYYLCLQAYAISETEKASAYMRHAIRENEEDYTFSPNNLVFNDFETKNKVCF